MMVIVNNIMPKWKKDETEFNVSVNDDGNGGFICRVPKPIIESLGVTDCIRFTVKKNQVVVSMGKKKIVDV